MSVEEGGQLIAGGDSGLDLIVAAADQGLEVARDLAEWLQAAQPVTIGAQEVGQAVAVAGVRFGARGAPAGTGGVEGVGVDGHQGVALGQQPLHDQAAGPLDGDRQPGRLAKLAQAAEDGEQAGLAVLDFGVEDDPAVAVDDGDVVALAGPVPTDVHGQTSIVARDNDDDAGAEGRSRKLIGRPSPRHVPNAGLRPSAHRGRRYSCWPSTGSRRWPCLSGHRRLRPSLNQAAARMVQQ
jgi:hypothetical protein